MKLMAIVTLPELLNNPNYPDDVKEKARLFLADCKGNSIGMYYKIKNFLNDEMKQVFLSLIKAPIRKVRVLN